ncbi:unnamed protein product [Soboliphyme baturini]|uniref:Uncharacterized protein n=1 Tax=Soboliphyme baturini TaxID=241478 RepID=A0A183IY86_9BILA|nr:unnamed protein product [Soboliphyme baturini]
MVATTVRGGGGRRPGQKHVPYSLSTPLLPMSAADASVRPVDCTRGEAAQATAQEAVRPSVCPSVDFTILHIADAVGLHVTRHLHVGLADAVEQPAQLPLETLRCRRAHQR